MQLLQRSGERRIGRLGPLKGQGTMGAECTSRLVLDRGQGQRTEDKGTKEHESAAGYSHHYNQGSRCFIMYPRPIADVDDCSRKMRRLTRRCCADTIADEWIPCSTRAHLVPHSCTLWIPRASRACAVAPCRWHQNGRVSVCESAPVPRDAIIPTSSLQPHRSAMQRNATQRSKRRLRLDVLAPFVESSSLLPALHSFLWADGRAGAGRLPLMASQCCDWTLTGLDSNQAVGPLGFRLWDLPSGAASHRSRPLVPPFTATLRARGWCRLHQACRIPRRISVQLLRFRCSLAGLVQRLRSRQIHLCLPCRVLERH
jgi:hypothetical protein